MDAKKSFDEFMQQVGLEEEYRENSWNLWESVSAKIAESRKDALIPWFVCTTYVTICNKRYTALQAGAGVMSHSLSKLLKAARMRMVDFFQKMKEFAEICEVGNPATESLTDLKKTFCISSAMFYKFKRVMPVVFKNDQALYESENAKDSFCKTCWLLFLICKGGQPHQIGDLMTAFYLLLCCVEYVHKRFLRLTRQPTGLPETNISLGQGILPDLCQESSVPYSMVNTIHAQCFQPFLDSKSTCNTRDLLDMDNLNSMYEEICDKCGDIDERDFFDKDSYLWIPFSESDSSGTLNGGSADTSLDEPHVITTSTAVLESRGPYPSPVNDLRTVLEETSDTPSQELLRFWKCCKRDPQSLIQSQLTAVQENYIKGFTEAVGEENSNISNQLFVRAKKLYFRVMEAMLLAEEKRLSCSDFSALLNSAAFHVSLMACSLEVVMVDSGHPCMSLAVYFICC